MIDLKYNLSAVPDQAQPILAWAHDLLQTYSDRRAIVLTHDLLDTGNNFTADGGEIFNAFKDRPNLFLMMGGHLATEGRRDDYGDGGNYIYSLRADYQNRPNGGDGWLRLLRFSPETNRIYVSTYSASLGTYETDADSQFSLNYDMNGAGFDVVGTASVASGANASVSWPNLTAGGQYEWYLGVSDGISTTFGPIWSFTTQPPCYALTLTHTGQGSDPTASPANSAGCPAGQYVAGESVALSGALPATGWLISGWSNTSNDSSTASTNSLTMPASAQTAGVNYIAITYTISGNAGLGGATLSYDSGGLHTVTAGGSGSYSLTVPYNWSGTVTPSKAGYVFAPDHRDYSNVMAYVTGEDYTATLQTFDLAVLKTGNGTISSDPAGIRCGPTCSAEYDYSTPVSLTAIPDAGWTFTGWSGGGCTGTGTCSVTVTGNTSVTANFSQNHYTLTVSSAHGAVTKTPDQATHIYGDVVQLSMGTVDAGWTFTGWSGGGCAGTGTC
ncbi:MAG TPA: hypothetical protein VF898_11690, partial [Chloroflexota bacterium]